MQKRNNILRVAVQKSDGGPTAVGFLLVARNACNAHIAKLVVAEHARGVGVGKSLLDSLLASLKESRCLSCTLHVEEARLVAQKLYASRGFKVAGKRLDDYYAKGRHAWKMELDMML